MQFIVELILFVISLVFTVFWLSNTILPLFYGLMLGEIEIVEKS